MCPFSFVCRVTALVSVDLNIVIQPPHVTNLSTEWENIKVFTKNVVASAVGGELSNESRVAIWQCGNGTELVIDTSQMGENRSMSGLIYSIETMQPVVHVFTNLSSTLHVVGEEMLRVQKTTTGQKSTMALLLTESSVDVPAKTEARQLHVAGVEMVVVSVQATSTSSPVISENLIALASTPIESNFIVCGSYSELQGASLAVTSQLQAGKYQLHMAWQGKSLGKDSHSSSVVSVSIILIKFSIFYARVFHWKVFCVSYRTYFIHQVSTTVTVQD